jgi:hypothetical protein
MISWRESAAPEGPLTFSSSRAQHSREFYTFARPGVSTEGSGTETFTIDVTYNDFLSLIFSESFFVSQGSTRSVSEFLNASTDELVLPGSTVSTRITYEQSSITQILDSFTSTSQVTLTSVNNGLTSSVVRARSETTTRAGTTWFPETTTTQTTWRQITGTTTTTNASLIATTSDNLAGWAFSAQTVTVPRTALSTVTVTRDTTTLESESQLHIAGLYNTVYQANTKNEADNAEVIYCLTETVAAYKAATEATSATRTTISAATQTTNITTTFRFQDDETLSTQITNSAVSFSYDYRSRTLRNNTSSSADYFELPPGATGVASFEEFDVSQTQIASTAAPSQTLAVFYNQSTTTEVWLGELVTLPVTISNFTYDTSFTQWSPFTRTTTTQPLVSSITGEFGTSISTSRDFGTALTSSETVTTVTGTTLNNVTTSTTETASSIFSTSVTGSISTTFETIAEQTFEQAANTILSAPRISRTTASSPAVGFSFFYPRGAVVANATGAVLEIDLPFTLQPPTQYTALQSPNETTVMPTTWTQFFGNESEDEEEIDENAPRSSASVSISGAGLTWKTSEEGNSESGTAAFTASGDPPEPRRVFSARSIAFPVNTFGTGVGIIPAGAYRNKDGTVTRSSHAVSYSQEDMDGLVPLRYIAPGTNTSSALVWAVPRNSTALPPT